MSARPHYSVTDHASYAETQKPQYTIGDLAREFGVSLRTLRFYEDRGLLNPQRDGLMRLYDGRDRTRLQIILKGKQLGFTLSEIHDMVGSADETTGDFAKLPLSSEQIRTQIDYLERQKDDIETALTELRQHQAE